MSSKAIEIKKKCTVCDGRGYIDMTVHIVLAGEGKTMCGEERPLTDRKRTTNPERANCGPCVKAFHDHQPRAIAEMK